MCDSIVLAEECVCLGGLFWTQSRFGVSQLLCGSGKLTVQPCMCQVG